MMSGLAAWGMWQNSSTLSKHLGRLLHPRPKRGVLLCSHRTLDGEVATVHHGAVLIGEPLMSNHRVGPVGQPKLMETCVVPLRSHRPFAKRGVLCDQVRQETMSKADEAVLRACYRRRSTIARPPDAVRKFVDVRRVHRAPILSRSKTLSASASSRLVISARSCPCARSYFSRSRILSS